MTTEKFFTIARFGGKFYPDGGIALVRDSKKIPGEKEIMVVGPWGGPGPKYIVEEWESISYKHLQHEEKLDLPDAVWDAVVRLRDIEKTDSVIEREKIIENFEKLVGVALLAEMHLAGADI